MTSSETRLDAHIRLDRALVTGLCLGAVFTFLVGMRVVTNAARCEGAHAVCAQSDYALRVVVGAFTIGMPLAWYVVAAIYRWRGLEHARTGVLACGVVATCMTPILLHELFARV